MLGTRFTAQGSELALTGVAVVGLLVTGIGTLFGGMFLLIGSTMVSRRRAPETPQQDLARRAPAERPTNPGADSSDAEMAGARAPRLTLALLVLVAAVVIAERMGPRDPPR